MKRQVGYQGCFTHFQLQHRGGPLGRDRYAPDAWPRRNSVALPPPTPDAPGSGACHTFFLALGP
jgi:hypothetical protein